MSSSYNIEDFFLANELAAELAVSFCFENNFSKNVLTRYECSGIIQLQKTYCNDIKETKQWDTGYLTE